MGELVCMNCMQESFNKCFPDYDGDIISFEAGYKIGLNISNNKCKRCNEHE